MTHWTRVRYGIRVKAYYIHEAPTKSQYASCCFAVQRPEYLGKLELTLLWMKPSSCVHKGQTAVVQHVSAYGAILRRGIVLQGNSDASYYDKVQSRTWSRLGKGVWYVEQDVATCTGECSRGVFWTECHGSDGRLVAIWVSVGARQCAPGHLKHTQLLLIESGSHFHQLLLLRCLFCLYLWQPWSSLGLKGGDLIALPAVQTPWQSWSARLLPPASSAKPHMEPYLVW